MFLLQPRFLLPVAACFGFLGLAFYVASDGSSALDSALVDPAATLGTQGALVLGQSQEGCYDPAAPRALAARGADLGTPVQLAQRLTDRWF